MKEWVYALYSSARNPANQDIHFYQRGILPRIAESLRTQGKLVHLEKVG